MERVVGLPEIVETPQWRNLDLSACRGLTMVVAAPDSGKSTFARYLYLRLRATGRRVAFLDGDPGQSVLGPPATMTLALPGDGPAAWPPGPRMLRRFVGATSVARRMPDVLAGASRLVSAAHEAGAEDVVYDTSGFVGPSGGGHRLKWAKVEALRPALIVAIQRERELEHLLGPLRRAGASLLELSAAPEVLRRNSEERRAYRREQFRRHFAGARRLTLDLSRLAVFPSPDEFAAHRLISLEDAEGFVLALGIVARALSAARSIEVLTPLAPGRMVEAVRAGDLLLEPGDFSERRPSRG